MTTDGSVNMVGCIPLPDSNGKYTCGGVVFDPKEVNCAIAPDGEKRGYIKFKNGVQITFPFQKSDKILPEASSREFSLGGFDTETELKGLHGVKLVGTDKRDRVIAESVHNCDFILDNDNKKDELVLKGDVKQDGRLFDKSYLNRVKLDEKDQAMNETLHSSSNNPWHTVVDRRTGPGTVEDF